MQKMDLVRVRIRIWVRVRVGVRVRVRVRVGVRVRVRVRVSSRPGLVALYSPAPMMSWGVVEKKRPNSQPPG